MNATFEKLAKTYLMSNACGMEDGFIKANTHRLLCAEYLCLRFGTNAKKNTKFDVLIDCVRKSTLPLTDHLDEKIGFPLNRAPNYFEMVPLFVAEFNRLATNYIQTQTHILSNGQLFDVLNTICHRKFGLVLHALESYGFEFVNGEANEFLVVKDYWGSKVYIKPNDYFGCSWEVMEDGGNDVEI